VSAHLSARVSSVSDRVSSALRCSARGCRAGGKTRRLIAFLFTFMMSQPHTLVQVSFRRAKGDYNSSQSSLFTGYILGQWPDL
jgi:hypothetical protein